MTASSASASLPLCRLRRIVAACDAYEANWRAGRAPRIESCLAEAPAEDRDELLGRLLELDVELRRSVGEAPMGHDYLERFPGEARVIDAAFALEELEVSSCGRESHPRATAGPPRLLGDYELLEPLGKGGMGVVYRARQLSAHRIVALKLILPDLLCELAPGPRQELIDRFLAEARAAAGLVHDHLVAVHEVGEADGYHFYSMRYVEGRSLAEALRCGPLPDAQAAAYLEPIARAIHYAHQQGIVHRDLKPRNILVSAEGRPLVADFGLAKWLGDGPTLHTPAGALLGTPSYLAPEQARGAENVGPASDVYGLGATLYEMLTGRPPFQAASAVETLRQVLDEEPVPPRRLNPAVAPDLETICLKCLAKEPSGRYPSALDLAEDVARYREGQPIRARRAGPLERAAKWARRRPAPAALILVVLLALLGAGVGWAWLENQARDQRVEGLVEALLAADLTEVPGVVEKLHRAGARAERRLRRLSTGQASEPATHFRAELALLPFDPGQVEPLFQRLMTAPPRQLLILRGALRPHSEDLVPRLWVIAEDESVDSEQRFRAACTLAGYDTTSPRWQLIGEGLVARLAREDPLLLGDWAELLRPVGRQFTGLLRKLFHDRRGTGAGRVAAALLAEYLVVGPEALVELLAEATPDQFLPLMDRVRSRPQAALRPIEARRAVACPTQASEPDKDRWAQRQTNLAVASIYLGHDGTVWPLLRHREDARLRTYLLHRLASLGVDPGLVHRQLGEQRDASIRRALLLSLGEYTPEQLPTARRARWTEQLLDLYRDNPDPGIHAAAEWLLRRWGQQRRVEQLTDRLPNSACSGRDWYLGPAGHTMILVRRPAAIWLGSPEDEAPFRVGETRRRGRPAPFAIASKETTIEQFRRFSPGHTSGPLRSRPPDCPATWLSWVMAARYCNWLSKQAGLPESQWCYRETGVKKIKDQGVMPYPNHLQRGGFRLPTEEEWEYACRAGTTTARYFGGAEDLMPHYAWWWESAQEVQPVGQLKPNDLGLFDALGNAAEWCWTASGPDGKLDPQVFRGGSVGSIRAHVRSASRSPMGTGTGMPMTGFRVARSLRTGQ